MENQLLSWRNKDQFERVPKNNPYCQSGSNIIISTRAVIGQFSGPFSAVLFEYRGIINILLTSFSRSVL